MFLHTASSAKILNSVILRTRSPSKNRGSAGVPSGRCASLEVYGVTGSFCSPNLFGYACSTDKVVSGL